MNANELADNQLTHVIGENNNGEEVVITLKKPLYPESFVRQQQAEIERLTMLCDCMTTESNRKGNEIEELKAHPLKELDEQFKKGFKAGKEEGWKAHKFHHPAKEQDTDCQYCKQGCIRCDARKQLTDEEIIKVYEDMLGVASAKGSAIDFAREVLRKAQEK